MGDDLPETSNLTSNDVQAPVSGTCEDEDQDEDEMLRRAIDLSLRSDDAPVCERPLESKLENYQYSPLPATDKTIRLLCIPPTKQISEPVVCQMRQVRLIDKPEYAALSYTWGDPIFDHHLICDGRRLAITAHLDAALRRFRTTTWWMLWVDAVCIDQTNIPERNYQVSIMKHIYSQAAMTFIYLGEACLQDAVALRLMAVLEKLAPLTKKYSLAELKNMEPLDALTPKVRDELIRFLELKDAGFPLGIPAASTGTTDLSSTGIPPPTDPAWEAMQSLFSRPWFSRMWIIQEVVMSSNVVAMLGHFCFPWGLVTHSIRAYIELGLLHVTRIPNQRVAMSFPESGRIVLNLLTVKNDSQCRSLIQLLKSFRQCLCSDPRDKVYALLGLANDQGAHKMVSVDYSKSVEAVYLECAQSLVRNGNGMEMLSQAGTPREREDTDLNPSLPSWVPDWSRECFNYFSQHGYRAAGQTQSDIDLEDRGNFMNVKGIRIDVIDVLAPVLTRNGPDGGFLRADLFAWQQKVREVAQQSCFFSEERVDDYANVIDAASCYRASVNTAYSSVDGLLEFFWNKRSSEKPNSNQGLEMYLEHVCTLASRYKFCVTRRGYMGWVPLSSLPGDFIIVLYGGSLPFTVRETNGKYILLGFSYLAGFMYGEALKLENAGPEDFILQ